MRDHAAHRNQSTHPGPDPIVVTGVGLITSVGIGREQFWKAILAGNSGVSPVAAFDTSYYPVHLGAEVQRFEPEEFVFHSTPTHIDRASQFAIAAARLAVSDAALPMPNSEANDIGIVAGTTSGEPRVIERFNDRYVAGEIDKIDSDFISTYPCGVLAAPLPFALAFL